jgi:hypothetical protein
MKRHHNMAPMYSDRRIVERAREMERMYKSEAAAELGVGVRRLERLMREYGLVFQVRYELNKPSGPIKTNQDMIDRYKIVTIDCVKCKKCTKCRQVKPLESYHRDKSKTTGRVSTCKSCVSSRKNRLLDGDPK